MISELLQILERGFKIMRLSSRMFLVGILVFVFPLLYIWAAQNFYSAAYDNVQTVLKYEVGIVSDSLQAVLVSTNADKDVLNAAIKVIMSENVETDPVDITAIRVYTETTNGMVVLAADRDELVGKFDPAAEDLKEMGFTKTTPFHQRESVSNDNRIWSAFKRVEVNNHFYYITSEYNLAQLDKTMAFRKQQSYLGLTGIFLFLIALAYWLNRQVHWEKRYEKQVELLSERDLFSNMIAHEFRSPLTAIKGYASFLEESQSLQPDERRFVGNIRQSAEHLVALVSDFLEVARLQAGKLKIEKQEIDIRTVVFTVLENLRGMATEKGLQLEVDPALDPIMFKTDPARLQQVLTNLVTNSIKYTQTGSIRLRCSVDYRAVSIRVMDTGMGISAEDQQKLFAPFTRVGGVDASSVTGTGLGMYITKQLVTLLGGTIGVESIKGVGSHVVVTLTESK